MIILNEQWYDEWEEGWIQMSYIINWWFTPPIVAFYRYGVKIYGDGKMINEYENSYSMLNKYLDARLKREVEIYVFTSY